MFSKLFVGRGGLVNSGCHYINVRYLKERAGKAVKPGIALVVENIPYKVTKIVQGKRGKGGGYVRAFLRNLESSGVIEKTFTSDELVELADLQRETVELSWVDSSSQSYVFMNMATFEEQRVSIEDVEDKDLLGEGQSVSLLKFKDKVIGVELPVIIECTAVEVNDSASGNLATLNTGAKIPVPDFVKPGNVLRINVAERKYVERANS